jgi:intracellular sulfur oxidation DsrE/DsrF family protein
MTTSATTPRRSFIGQAATAMLGIASGPSIYDPAPRLSSAAPDESWLRGLTGKHRQFFDTPTVRDGRPLLRIANYLDGYAEAYGTTDPQTNAICGVHGEGLALVLSDAVWAKYDFGKRFMATDPLTRAPAVRNPYVKSEPGYPWPTDYSITRLQQRGVRFVSCMKSLRLMSLALAPDPGGAAEVLAELMRNLLPGVTPVVAAVVATNRAQEAGLAYIYAG